MRTTSSVAAATSLLYLLSGVKILKPAYAGEIVLYSSSSCDNYPYIFAAGATSNCIQKSQIAPGIGANSASTSHNIGPSCLFHLYTDNACKTLAAKLNSSGPVQSCVSFPKGMQSYQVTCGNTVGGTLVRPRAESDVTLNSYLQPPVTFRNQKAGNISFSGYNDFCGSRITVKPTGNPTSIGTKLASAFFSGVPSSASKYTFSASDGGTLYTVTATGYAANGYTAFTIAQKTGMAAFASIMADTAAQLASNPCNYLYYGLSNANHLDEEMGSINITYVAPS